MTAEIVSVGTELLLGQIVDTDAAHLAQVLPEYGVACHRRQTVGDNLDRLAETLAVSLDRADIVFTIGGLGPTEDDLTRDAISIALNEPLMLDEKIAEKLRKLFAYRKLTWTESQLRQAMRPSCSEPIENPNGTAPGLLCRHSSGKVVIALPGPKGEFVPMVEGPVRAFLATLNTGRVIVSHILKTAGIGEAALEEKVRHLIHGGNPSVAPYAHPGEVHLRITAAAASHSEAEDLIEPIERELREVIGQAVYGGKEDTLESVVVHELCRRDEKLAVAESCTGGGLGDRITSVRGSSKTFVGGIICYANEIKSKLLGVSEETLKTKGAVSEECAREMAEGVCSALDSHWGISITGIAGPDGGSEQKPVGLVYIGVSGPNGTTVEEYRFRGGREGIRQRSVQMALIQIWMRLKT